MLPRPQEETKITSMTKQDAQHTSESSGLRLDRHVALEIVLVASGFVLFLVLLWEMTKGPEPGTFLNPPLVAVAMMILLWPVRKQRTVRALLLAAGFLLLMWFLTKLSSVLAPFGLVYILAYLFNPLVDKLELRFRVPRWVSSLIVTVLCVGAVAFLFLLLVPNLVGELRVLASHIVTSIDSVREWMTTTTIFDPLEEKGLIDVNALDAALTTFVQEQTGRLASGIPSAAEGMIRYVGSLLGVVMTATLVPVMLFYTMKDFPYIQSRLVRLFPTMGGRRDYLVQVGGIVGNYLRGQLTISGIVAVIVSVALTLFGVPFALLIGLIAGVLNMVPNLGILMTYVVGGLIALVFGNIWDALIVVGVLLGESFLESSVLTPRILSQHVGLHPVLILLSLFVFGYFMGFFGLLIAVPATAVLMTVYRAYRDDLTLELVDFPDANDEGSTSAIGDQAKRAQPETFGQKDAPKGDSTLSASEHQPS